MLSESARMTTARESAFRIDHPNSIARVIKVVALDAFSIEVVRKLAVEAWRNATFYSGISADWDPGRPAGTPVNASLIDLAGRGHDLIDEIGSANLIVMIVTAGESAEAASLIAEVCSLKRVMITGLLLTTPSSTDEQIARTLRTLRPYAPMLVVSGEEEYVAAMLTALRA